MPTTPPKNATNANLGSTFTASHVATTTTASKANAATQRVTAQNARTIRGVQYSPISRKSLRRLFPRCRRWPGCAGTDGATGVATGKAVGGSACGGATLAKSSVVVNGDDAAGETDGAVGSEITGGGAGGRLFGGARKSRERRPAHSLAVETGYASARSGTSTRAWQCGHGDDKPAFRASTSNPFPHDAQVAEIVGMIHRKQGERHQRNPLGRAKQQSSGKPRLTPTAPADKITGT